MIMNTIVQPLRILQYFVSCQLILHGTLSTIVTPPLKIYSRHKNLQVTWKKRYNRPVLFTAKR